MARLTYSSSAGTRLSAMFREQVALSGKEPKALCEKHGGELAANLYLETPRADRTQIQTKVESLGGRFIRAPRQYAAKVGPKAKAFFKANASKTEKKLRTARTKEKRAAKKEGRKAGRVHISGRRGKKKISVGLRKGLTVTEEKFAALTLRLGRRGAAKASWIPAMKRFKSKLKVAKGDEKRASEVPMSEAMITGDASQVSAVIINRQSGIAKLNNNTGFVDRALEKTAKNIEQYNIRKRAEIAGALRKAART